MVNNSKAYKIAKYAVVFAIIFVAMMLDRLLTIIPGFSTAACVLLVTLSFCFLENSWSMGVISGTFFGLASFLKEMWMPTSLVGAVFPEPYYRALITIPPRIIMGVVAFSVYRLLLFLTKNMKNGRKRQILSLIIASLFGLLANTIGFFSFVQLTRSIACVENEGFFNLIYGALTLNIIPEYVVSIACVWSVVLGVRRGLKLGVDGNNWKKQSAEE